VDCWNFSFNYNRDGLLCLIKINVVSGVGKMKNEILDKKELERYKKQIDEDFKIFPINKRLFQLEKSWIKNLSHNIMPTRKKYFTHEDRKKLRKELIKYLNSKAKPKINKNLIWEKKTKNAKEILWVV